MKKKFSRDERREIGKLIYDGNVSANEAAIKYDISVYTARDYYREYKALLSLGIEESQRPINSSDRYEAMSKDDLIYEIIKLRVEKEKSKPAGDKEVIKGWGKRKADYRIVETLSHEFKVSYICRVMGIDASNYLHWKKKNERKEEEGLV